MPLRVPADAEAEADGDGEAAAVGEPPVTPPVEGAVLGAPPPPPVGGVVPPPPPPHATRMAPATTKAPMENLCWIRIDHPDPVEHWGRGPASRRLPPAIIAFS